MGFKMTYALSPPLSKLEPYCGLSSPITGGLCMLLALSYACCHCLRSAGRAGLNQPFSTACSMPFLPAKGMFLSIICSRVVSDDMVNGVCAVMFPISACPFLAITKDLTSCFRMVLDS